MAYSLYCFKHGIPFISYETRGLPQAACPTCLHDETDARIEQRLQQMEQSIERVKEKANGNATRRNNRRISDDISASKT